jgi:uncharacterized protein YbaP (TraB family)
MANEPATQPTLEERRQRVMEFMDEMNSWPSETEVMSVYLATAGNSSASLAQRTTALASLETVVEQIDHANDLPKLGGITVLVDALREGGPMQLSALKVSAHFP